MVSLVFAGVIASLVGQSVRYASPATTTTTTSVPAATPTTSTTLMATSTAESPPIVAVARLTLDAVARSLPSLARTFGTGWVLDTSRPVDKGSAAPKEAWQTNGGFSCSGTSTVDWSLGTSVPVKSANYKRPSAPVDQTALSFRNRRLDLGTGTLIYEYAHVAVAQAPDSAAARQIVDNVVTDASENCRTQIKRANADDTGQGGVGEFSLSISPIAVGGSDQAWAIELRGQGCVPDCENPTQRGPVENPVRIHVFQRAEWVLVVMDTELDQGPIDRFTTHAELVFVQLGI